MLNISEHFYSIQGEGHTVGVPAYFIRLQGCNLMCGGPNASLVKEGKATWWCDSEVIWKRGKQTTNEELIESWKEQDIFNRILSGNINIIWTGGEPTIPRHQKAISEFLDYAFETYDNANIFNEIETNGTIVTADDFYENNIDQINCSPKLANSGMAESMRIIPAALEQINNHHNGWFKFVVSEEKDFEEIQKTYLQPFNIPDKKVIIMPGVDNRDDLPERTAFLFDMAKKYGYRAITRQHILAWDRVTGV
jgi:7-carboxy-7-deazaguanine synthase